MVTYLATLARLRSSTLLVAAALAAGCTQQPVRVVDGMQTGPRVIKQYDPMAPGPVAEIPVTEVQARPGGLSGVAMPSQPTVASVQMQEENLSTIEPAAGPSQFKASTLHSTSPVQTAPKAAPPKVEQITHTTTATDTIYKLARQYDTTAQQILTDNGMKSPTEIRPGQTLTILRNSKPQGSVWADVKTMLTDPAPQPTQTATSHVNDASLAAIEPAAGRGPQEQPAQAASEIKFVMHTVQPKETIYRISLQYNASVLDIMAANEFSEPQDLKADSIIRVPLKTDLPSQLASAKAPEAAKEQVMAQAVESGVVGKQEAVKAELETKAVKEQAQSESQMETANVKPVTIDMAKLAEQKRGQIDQQAARAKGLVWPVKGEIVRKFGDDGNGVALTGINIAVPEGTPVLAAEGGKVLYADNGLKVYGNLVLVRHDNGMVSAYAHNGYLLVKKNESVRKGQVIALSGASGNVERPQLHFELRQHASAVDPLRVLPSLSSL
jgi:murein DD-endopeptidase MepM/ murein hydrolase activator NlpD